MNIFSWLPDKKFIKQSFVLSSATVLAQVVSFIGSLILFRIYTPAEYGKFGIFVTVSSLVSLVGTGQLQHAVFISGNKKETEQIISVMMLLSLVVSIVVALLLAIFYGRWEGLGVGAILLLPLSILAGGYFFFLSALAASTRSFDLLSYQKIFSAIIGPVISIAIGIWYQDAIGLVAGFLISQVVSVVIFYNKLNKLFRFNFFICTKDLVYIFTRFKKFPLFTLPSELVNALVNQLPLILLGRYYSLEAVGHYKMAVTILNLPIGAIAIPVSTVFKQQAAAALAAFRTCREIYLKTTRILILSGSLPYLVLGLFGSGLLPLIFGPDWQPAGKMVQILAGLYFARFVVSPLTSVTQLTGHQQFALGFNIFLLILTFILFYGGHQTGASYRQLLSAYAMVYGSLYLFTYAMCLRFCSHAGQD